MERPRPARNARHQYVITAKTLRLIVLLGIAGGFLDAFTFVAHGGVFANAQTGNVVLLGVAAAHGDAAGALRHVPPLIAFVLGVAAAETLTHPRVAPLMRRPIRVALVIEIAVLLVMGAIPTWFAGSAVLGRPLQQGRCRCTGSARPRRCFARLLDFDRRHPTHPPPSRCGVRNSARARHRSRAAEPRAERAAKTL